MMSNRTKSFALLLVGVVLLFTLSGCATLQEQMNRPTPTIEPTPTLVFLPTQLSTGNRVTSQTCTVADLVTIQTDKVQGDLLAWSPEEPQLALLQPTNLHAGWYIGNLAIYDVAREETSFFSKNGAVFGDLTWSPNGSRVAAVILDQEAGIYTVRMIDPATGEEVDLFGEEARTDDFASQKGIVSWYVEAELVVSARCGADCVRWYRYNPVSQALNQQTEMRYQQDNSLALASDSLSPDGKWELHIDNEDNTWVTLRAENRVSLVLAATEVMEARFSSDSQYLALRTSDRVLIYELGCQQPAQTTP